MKKIMLSYSGNDAAAYAINHALKPNPKYRYFTVHGSGGGDCTNFVSQCLRFGGAPFVSLGNNQWWYDKNACSISWAVAGSLYWYLKINFSENLHGIKGTEISSPSKLSPGDIIFYENSKGRVRHSAIVTSISGNCPLISQHTPNLLNVSYKKDWASKMHFFKISL